MKPRAKSKGLCLAAVTALTLLAASAEAATNAKAEIQTEDQTVIGNISFRQTKAGVLIFIQISKGLPPGGHGVQLHDVGRCSPDFAASGTSINQGKKQHGLDNQAGPKSGNLPNIYADSRGRVQAEMFTARVTLSKGKAALLDKNGSAIVIYSRWDDQKSQPIGGAGRPIACGVIEEMS